MNVWILILAAAIVSLSSVFAALTPRQKELLGHSLIHRGDGKGRPDYPEAIYKAIGELEKGE